MRQFDSKCRTAPPSPYRKFSCSRKSFRASRWTKEPPSQRTFLAKRLPKGLTVFANDLSSTALFTKWRAVITIGVGLPTRTCIETNANALALFAALSQEAG